MRIELTAIQRIERRLEAHTRKCVCDYGNSTDSGNGITQARKSMDKLLLFIESEFERQDAGPNARDGV